MRIKIKLEMKNGFKVIPLNYQYPISSWIYSVFAKADKDFTDLLHSTGYRLENGKSFKLFTFSRLEMPRGEWRIIPKTDRMEVSSTTASLKVAFQLPESAEKFIIGIFKDAKMSIGDKKSRVEAKVVSIEILKNELPKKNEYHLKTNSAITMGLKVENRNTLEYILPTHEEYSNLIIKNLLEKYHVVTGKDMAMENIGFEVTKLETKTNLQLIKADTPEMTRVKGYYYEFKIRAPKELVEVGLNSGFGSKNSLGWGYCELVEE